MVAEGERVYRELLDRGIEAVLDDREETAGVKFADADLIGYPVQVVIGAGSRQAPRTSLRSSGERSQAELAGAAEAAASLLGTAP